MIAQHARQAIIVGRDLTTVSNVSTASSLSSSGTFNRVVRVKLCAICSKRTFLLPGARHKTVRTSTLLIMH